MLRAIDFILILTVFIALSVLWFVLPHRDSEERNEDISDLIANSADIAWLTLGAGGVLFVNLVSDFAILSRTETYDKKLRAVQTALILCSLMLPSVVITIVNSGEEFRSRRILEMFISVITVRRVVFIGSFVIGLLDSPSGLFPKVPVLFVAICFMSEIIIAEVRNTYDSVGVFSAGYVLLALGLVSFSMLISRYMRYLVSLKTVPSNERGTLVIMTCAVLSLLGNLLCRNLKLSNGEHRFDGQLTNLIVATIAILLPGKIESRYLLSIATNLLEMKKGFVRYVSHEVRTPLNVATVGMAMLSEDITPALTNEQMAVLSQVKEGIDAAIEVLSELLTYDKITSNLMTLEKTKVEVLEFLTSSLSMFRLQAQQKSVAFRLAFREKPEAAAVLSGRMLEIDAHKIRQVLRNFASNAVKFTPAGGVIEVRAVIEKRAAPLDIGETFSSRTYALMGHGNVSRFLSRRTEESTETKATEWLVVEVEDSGAGLTPEQLPRVFHEIVQFNANKLQEGKGTGLGLYISRSIVELHEGTVSVDSEGENKGCVFSLAIPLSEEKRSHRLVTLRRAPIDPWIGFAAPNSREENSIQNSRSGGRDEGPTIRRVIEELPIVGNFIRKPVAASNGDSPRSVSIRSSIKIRPADEDRVVSFEGCPTKSESLESQFVGRRLRALVADDSKASAKMVAMYLQRLNIDVEMVEDGVAAVEAIRSSLEMESQNVARIKSFDFVLMDNHMPKMDGPTACLNMREIGFSGPIFGLTGDASAEESSVYLSSGASKVFSKPLDVSAFKSALVSFNLHAERQAVVSRPNH